MADTLDLLTLAAGKAAINMRSDNTDHDSELTRQITAVSRMVDAACGPVVQRTVTAEIHDGDAPLFLRFAPVASISLVRVAQGAAITTLSAVAFGGTGAGYYADVSASGRLSGLLERRSGAYQAAWGGQVEVTYVAGRYANTAAVDARFAECAASVLRRLWKRESTAWAQSPEFFESLDPQGPIAGSGFFRVAKPIIDEMLWDELVLPGVA